jgi:aspartyl-tRNA(Asn)/glutamyl-tRNA(Gln) amidotransferase subunit B
MGKNIAKQMLANGKSAREIVEREGLQQITDEEEIRKIVQQVIGTNPKAWKDLLAGKERALGFLIGQVMRKSQGKANPRIVNKIIKEQMK